MKRLGANGAQEVKQHPWFDGFDWDMLADLKMKSPFVPKNAENFDAANCQAVWNDDNEAHIKHSHELLQRDSVQDLFTNYEYDEHKKLLQLKKELQRQALPENQVRCYGIDGLFACSNGGTVTYQQLL
jgi:hypothetical protein